MVLKTNNSISIMRAAGAKIFNNDNETITVYHHNYGTESEEEYLKNARRRREKFE